MAAIKDELTDEDMGDTSDEDPPFNLFVTSSFGRAQAKLIDILAFQ